MLVVQLIWSVLVLITMLVTHQPACLNPFTISYPRAPRPPYTTTRPLIPELGVPESEATIGSAAYSHSHTYVDLSLLEAVVIDTTSGNHLEKEITIVKLLKKIFLFQYR